MPARRFNEGDIDFEAIDTDLAKLAPAKLSLKDVLDRLRERLLEQRAKGVTVAQTGNGRGRTWAKRAQKSYAGRKWPRVAMPVGGSRGSKLAGAG